MVYSRCTISESTNQWIDLIFNWWVDCISCAGGDVRLVVCEWSLAVAAHYHISHKFCLFDIFSFVHLLSTWLMSCVCHRSQKLVNAAAVRITLQPNTAWLVINKWPDWERVDFSWQTISRHSLTSTSSFTQLPRTAWAVWVFARSEVRFMGKIFQGCRSCDLNQSKTNKWSA